jgi:hypothetical protein
MKLFTPSIIPKKGNFDFAWLEKPLKRGGHI